MNEGSPYNAATLNALLQSLLAGVNNIVLETSVLPRAFDAQHLPSLLAGERGTDVMKSDGMDVTSTHSPWVTQSAMGASVAYDVYSNELAPAGGWPKNLQTIAGLGPGGGAGWRRISNGGGVGTECKVSWAPGSTFNDYPGYMVAGSVAIGHTSAAQPLTHDTHGFALAFAIQDSAGNFYVVPRTVRMFCGMTSPGERVSLLTMLTQADLVAAAASHGGNADVADVTMVFGRFDINNAGVDIRALGGIELGPYNIMQLPLQFDTLS